MFIFFLSKNGIEFLLLSIRHHSCDVTVMWLFSPCKLVWLVL